MSIYVGSDRYEQTSQQYQSADHGVRKRSWNPRRWWRGGEEDIRPSRSLKGRTKVKDQASKDRPVLDRLKRGGYSAITAAALSYISPSLVLATPLVAEGVKYAVETSGETAWKWGVKLFKSAVDVVQGTGSTSKKVAGVAMDIGTEAATYSSMLWFSGFNPLSVGIVLLAATVRVIRDGTNKDLNAAIEYLKRESSEEVAAAAPERQAPERQAPERQAPERQALQIVSMSRNDMEAFTAWRRQQESSAPNPHQA